VTEATLESSNAALRHAVESRLAGRSPMAASLEGCKPALAAATQVLSDAAELAGNGPRAEESETYAEWTPPDYSRREEAVRGWQRLIEETRPGRIARHASVAQQTLLSAIDAVVDRHGKYGPPVEHFARTAGLVNAAFGTTFSAADWALVMVLDKIARQRGPAATDDAAIDIAGYAACHEECRRAEA
jgi:hypothetical protein